MLMDCIRSAVSRRTFGLTLATCGLLICGSGGEAFAQTKTSKKPRPEEITRLTKTGIKLKMTYFASELGEDAPVVILLHGKGGNRLVWNRQFAPRLQLDTDFAVITVDLSGHGESDSRSPKGTASGKKADAGLKAGDYQAMVFDDLETVKRLIFELHQKKELNMTKLAIIGADFSAAVAVFYADQDWQKPRYDDAPIFEQQTPRGEDVRGLILLSPEEHVPGLNVQQAALRLKLLPMPAMIGVSKKDKLDRGAAKKMYEHLAPKKAVDPEKQYVYLIEYEGQLRGTDLLNREDQKVENNMIAFLQKHVAALEYEWRDRRSALDRDDKEDEPAKKKKK